MIEQQMLLIAIGIYSVLLGVTAYFTRATLRRFLGALAGGLTVALIGVGIEIYFQSFGFWYYPSAANQPYGPKLMYLLVIVMWATLALLGWRVMRRFGWNGQLLFLTGVTIIGTSKDYLVAGQVLGYIVISPGLLTVLVGAACWAGTTALAQAVMRLIAGNARDDSLARRS